MKMRWIWFWLVVLSLNIGGLRGSTALLLHPVHISVVNLDVLDNKTLVFSVKLFKDDFARILNKKNHTTIQFDKHTKLKEVQNYVNAYIFENFKIEGASSKENYYLTKMKISDVAVWFYFKIVTQDSKNKDYKSLKVTNSLMTDLYQDQVNLFIMNYKGEDLAHRFDNSDISYIFSFE